jgi:hypothetical protein
MSLSHPETVLLPVDLGSVDNYDPTVFPLARVTGKGSLHTGHLFLQATLDEMLKIRELSKEQASNPELLRDTKAQFDEWVHVPWWLQR